MAALCIVLVAVALPLGSNRPWAWTVLETVVFALVAIWAVTCLRHARWPPTAARLVLAAMAVWLLYGALYLAPLPASTVQFLAPAVYAAYHQAIGIVGNRGTGYYLSLDRQATLQAVLKYAMYGAAFLLVTVLVTSRTRLKVMLYTLLAAGVIEVALALGARAMGVDLTPRSLMDGHWNVLRGTFVNRNDFAIFLAMSSGVGIGLALAHVDRSHLGSSFKTRLLGILDRLEASVLIPAAAVVLMLAGMVMSTSRGGITALAVALILVLTLSVVARGRQARELLLLWPLGVVVLVGVLWSGSRTLLGRLATSGVGAGERWVQWAGTRDLIVDHWLTGTGPGTYQYAFTAYKDAALRPLLYDHAHNDYLELLAGQGVIGAALLGLVVAIVLYGVCRAFMTRRDPLIRGALFASLTGMLAMLVHALVAFSFRIPATALYFWVLAGVGLASARLGRETPDPYRTSHRSGFRRRRGQERNRSD